MPTNREIAEWLREAADDIEQEISPLLGRVLSGPYTKKLRERADLVEQSTAGLCETCRWLDYTKQMCIYPEGPMRFGHPVPITFGCVHHQEKE